MPNTECLQLRTALPVQALNAGLFISKGERSHPKHTTESYELIFVRQGILGIQEEGRIYRIEPGEVLVLRPDRDMAVSSKTPKTFNTIGYTSRLTSRIPPIKARLLTSLGCARSAGRTS